MRILFVRHGEPDYEHDSLTPKGFREAELLADRLEKLKIKDFYCSPQGRARATAEPTLKRFHKEAVVYDWLREFSGYILDKETNRKRIPWDLYPEDWTCRPAFYRNEEWYRDPIMTTGDVEEVYTYIAENIDLFLEQYGYHRDGNMYVCEESNPDTIVIFCHLGVQFAILSHVLGIPAPLLWQGFCVAPSSVTTLISEERVKGKVYFRCQSVGDTSHLYAAKEPISTAGFFQETYGAPKWPDTKGF